MFARVGLPRVPLNQIAVDTLAATALGAVIIHHAGRIGVDAHLVLDRTARQRIACSERAIVIDEELGHDEQRNALDAVGRVGGFCERSEEHTSELQSLMRISYAVFCLKKKILTNQHNNSVTTELKR